MSEVRTTSSTGGQKGVKLQRFDLIPIGPLTELAEHYGRGAQKYAPHQWRQGYEWSKSYAAAQRHLTAFWDGEDYDVCPSTKEGCASVTAAGEPFVTDIPNTCYNHTGSHHLLGASWHMFALMEFRHTHPEHDDRYKAETEMEAMSKRVQARLNEEPNCRYFNTQLLVECKKPAGHKRTQGPGSQIHENGKHKWVDTFQSVCGHVLKSDEVDYEMVCTRPVNHREMTELSNYPYHGYAGCFWNDEGKPV